MIPRRNTISGDPQLQLQGHPKAPGHKYLSVLVSCSKYQRTTPQRETPLEIPSEDIARKMEAAATSSNANLHDDDDDEVDVMSTAD